MAIALNVYKLMLRAGFQLGHRLQRQSTNHLHRQSSRLKQIAQKWKNLSSFKEEITPSIRKAQILLAWSLCRACRTTPGKPLCAARKADSDLIANILQQRLPVEHSER